MSIGNITANMTDKILSSNKTINATANNTTITDSIVTGSQINVLL
jgi:hypothetical protein